jgi:hypothetical protein
LRIVSAASIIIVIALCYDEYDVINQRCCR